MSKNTKHYVCGVYILFWSVLSILIFISNIRYIYLYVLINTQYGIEVFSDGIYTIYHIPEIIQLFLQLFSGITGLYAFIRKVSGKWLIVSGCLGMSAKVICAARNLIVSGYAVKLLGEQISVGLGFSDILYCCFPLVYALFFGVIAFIGVRQLKTDCMVQSAKWFPFFRKADCMDL